MNNKNFKVGDIVYLNDELYYNELGIIIKTLKDLNNSTYYLYIFDFHNCQVWQLSFYYNVPSSSLKLWKENEGN